MSNLPIPTEAVEAALWAWIESAAEGVTRENVSPRVLDLNRPRAAAALTAALPILHPTIPNTIEALEQLPEGSIIRHDEGLLWVRIAEHLWADGPHEPAVTTQRVTLSAPTGTAWTVLWPLGGAA